MPSEISWYAFAVEYAQARWIGRSAHTRRETSEALAAITRAMLYPVARRPNETLLHRSLQSWAFTERGPAAEEVPTTARQVLDWVARASRPLVDLHDPTVARAVMDALRRKRDGTAAAVETWRRKRKVLSSVLHYAIERGELTSHPLKQIRWSTPRQVKAVDPRVVINPLQARILLNAVSYVGNYHRAKGRRLVGFFAGMYYAGLRPEEAVAVAVTDCTLPATGWGRMVVNRALPQVGKKWTDSGRRHDDRGLKNRPPGDTRVVPLPPHLVAIWRESIAAFGIAEDGRLFFNERGGIVGSTTYYRVWEEARTLALPPQWIPTPLAARPYDLRHSALSTWLCSGADPAEVAQGAGNSVEVLLTRYAKCLYDRQSIANNRIEHLLTAYDSPVQDEG
ncbi:tyrosine-type recombinase/integrase [Streptomyces sp. NPDC017056]|uniref:tyrosine-type recombinase/integrase n=1 Tax=Streptomyces sp. NPDC017056 TaxID=3364973 RepID=UPI0037895E36